MKKLKATWVALVLNLCIGLRVLAGPPTPPPDEGMWLPLLISQNIEEMRALGFKLTAEDIYSVNKSSLKDAIPQFAGGCTSELISPDGLILTNHHCGYDAIAARSTTDHNYLRDGFWAMTRAEEIPNPDLEVKFLVRMEDVTSRLLAQVAAGATEDERERLVQEAITALEEAAIEGTHYTAEVKDFFNGSEYYLFVYEVFTDVRLVGTPPESVGKFGGDTDNWMWPRHTGDFSMFRIYAGPDNKPAAYSTSNVPYKPRHFLKINVGGVKKGDPAMVMGWPGNTDRYLTGHEMEVQAEKINPLYIKLFGKKLEVIKTYMDADPAVKIQYASEYARTANAWKYFIGQTEGLAKLDVIEEKKQQEKAFNAWVAQSNKSEYEGVIRTINDNVDASVEGLQVFLHMNVSLFAPKLVLTTFQKGFGLYSVMDPGTGKNKRKVDAAEVRATADALATQLDEIYGHYHMPVDRETMATMFALYAKDIAADKHPEIFKLVQKKFKGDYAAYAAFVYANSVFATKEKLAAFLKAPKWSVLQNDPAIQLAQGLVSAVRAEYGAYQQHQHANDVPYRQYVAGLREMQPDKKFYPNANSTMRVTYGTVQDYSPADAVHYDYYTTARGILQKEDPKDEEFVVPDKLVQLLKNKDYGRWGAEDGQLHVCVLTNNDITGGNSGSPLLDGHGHLIGLAFDGNWEAMTGDLVYDTALKRTINVDIRYVLFLIDKLAGASHLIDEMELVKD